MASAVDAVAYMDRRLTEASPGVSVAYSGGVTTWTLPYSVATDGTEGTLTVALRDAPMVLVGTRPAPNQIAATGDYTARLLYFGVLFPFRYVPSRVIRRDPQGNAYIGGRVMLIRLSTLLSEATNATVTVRRSLRAASSYVFTKVRASTGKLLALVQAWADESSVEITDLSPGSLTISGLVWEGKHYTDVERT